MTLTTPYRETERVEASSVVARINANDAARRQAHKETVRANQAASVQRAAMEEAGWDEGIPIDPDPTPPPTEAMIRAAARVAELKLRDKEHKARYTERRRRDRERGVEVAKTSNVANRIAAATTEDWTMHAPLLALEWEDSPGLMTATDGTLLFALKRKGEAEWSVSMGVADKDVPGLDVLAVKIVSSHRSHCEALEYAEGLRAGWYTARAMKRSQSCP